MNEWNKIFVTRIWTLRPHNRSE